MGRRTSSQESIPRSQERRDSIYDANDFIEEFVREGWESQWHSIKIICELTLDELFKLGNLPRPQGTRACRKLVKVPVINDEIACALWERLATMARGEGSLDDPAVARAYHNFEIREQMRQEINASRKKLPPRVESPPPKPCILCPSNHQHPGYFPEHEQHEQQNEPPRKVSWSMLSGRRRSSAGKSSTALAVPVSPTSPTFPASPKFSSSPGGKHDMKWQEGFWKQDNPGSSLSSARMSPEPEISEAAGSGSNSPKFNTKASLPRRIFRKLSGQLVGNVGEFGESLGVGYGSREQGLVMTPYSERPPSLRQR